MKIQKFEKQKSSARMLDIFEYIVCRICENNIFEKWTNARFYDFKNQEFMEFGNLYV